MRDIKAVLVVIVTIGVIIAAAVAGVSLLGGGKKEKPEQTISGNLEQTGKANAKAVSVDPFDGLEVTFSGTSPNAVMDNIDRKTKEGAWVSYTCEPSDGLALGQKVTVKASLQDTENYRLKNKEQVYTVEGVDAYINRISDVTGDVIKRMREKAEAEFTVNTTAKWPSDAALNGLSYCGMYFLTPKDPASVKDQNRATLVYKVDLERDGRKAAYYTYTTFYNLIKKTDGSIALDINRFEIPQARNGGDDQIMAAGITTAGYTDPERLKKTCVTDQSGYYRCESSVSKLDILTEAENASETETAETTASETTAETTTEKDTEETAVADTTEEDADDVVETDKEESASTTKASETTTKAPETTTKAPETTTKAPETTTKELETTTKAPETTTREPETTTKAPETTTKAPETTTKAPETTTKEPETTENPPESSTETPETPEVPAVTGTEEPETPAAQESPAETPNEMPAAQEETPAAQSSPAEPAGYEKVLDDYRKVLAGDAQGSFHGLPIPETDPAEADPAAGPVKDSAAYAYAFYDLNGDGQDELIITNRLLIEEPDAAAAEETDVDAVEEAVPDDSSENPADENPEGEEVFIPEAPEDDPAQEPAAEEEAEPVPVMVRPDEIHILTMEMPDSGEEEESLFSQARELLCDTENEHYTILSDHTIRCSQADLDADQYYVMDEFGGLNEALPDPGTLSALTELYFDSSIWQPVLPAETD